MLGNLRPCHTSDAHSDNRRCRSRHLCTREDLSRFRSGWPYCVPHLTWLQGVPPLLMPVSFWRTQLRALEVIVEVSLRANPSPHAQNVCWQTLRGQLHVIAGSLPQILAFAQQIVNLKCTVGI